MNMRFDPEMLPVGSTNRALRVLTIIEGVVVIARLVWLIGDGRHSRVSVVASVD